MLFFSFLFFIKVFYINRRYYSYSSVSFSLLSLYGKPYCYFFGFCFPIIKVLRLLQKTFLFFYEFFIIKFFLFQRKTLLLSISISLFLYSSSSLLLRSFVFNGRTCCYSSVSFSLSLLLLRSSVFNGRPSCYSSVSFSL